MQGVCCYQVCRANRRLLALKHPQHRKQRFGSLNRAMEDETCGGFSENRPFLSISLLPPSFRPPWFLIRPGLPASALPALQPTVPASESFGPRGVGGWGGVGGPEKAQALRPLITWPQATFSPAARISLQLTDCLHPQWANLSKVN